MGFLFFATLCIIALINIFLSMYKLATIEVTEQIFNPIIIFVANFKLLENENE